MKNNVIRIILCSFITSVMFAHPVIFKSGRVITSQYTHKSHEKIIHYSATRFLSLGLSELKLKNNRYTFFTKNWLLNRKNTSKTQSNLYLLTGIGSQENGSTVTSFAIQADWESQTLYTLGMLRILESHSTVKVAKLRFGFSPYKTSYDKLSTWFILEANMIENGLKKESELLPMIRLFKDNILLELGHNFNDNYLLTAMIHL